MEYQNHPTHERVIEAILGAVMFMLALTSANNPKYCSEQGPFNLFTISCLIGTVCAFYYATKREEN